MIFLNLNEIAEAVGSLELKKPFGKQTITSVGFDTRKLSEGSLFVPLKGKNNGHEFIEEAIEKGAVAALWSESPAKAPTDFPIIQVDDTLLAMQQLASYYLNKVSPKVVAVTGSNGKTTTKDMTEAVIGTKYKVHKTQGNFNNHIGLPYTLLEMPEDTEVVILEMGMNHAGEINVLSNLAKPDIAVITMIGESHIEYFNSRAGIADAKMEIVSGLKKNGTLIYPGSEPLLNERVKKLKTQRLVTFGQAKENAVYPLEMTVEMEKTLFKVNMEPDLVFSIPVLGVYNVNNALAALSAGKELGVSLADAAPALANFQLTKSRTEWVKGINHSFILNDAYNANPTAMKAVIKTFGELKTEGRKLVVLGDMLELGEWSEELHKSIKEVIKPSEIEQVLLYGEKMKALENTLVGEGVYSSDQLHHFSGDKQAMIDFLKQIIQPNDLILVKSSFGTDLLSLIPLLADESSKQ
ncbi:MAG: UDP-N-acetylmuramoyl-tripeptide--D-alanyl-D-alanine ligase [Pisciglobus halotolerans]|nr:UDP-N-acetylmuramoyl-tripeptide--D-alanyl-D-alanine ligase [Pisciglobus halotolerans]